MVLFLSLKTASAVEQRVVTDILTPTGFTVTNTSDGDGLSSPQTTQHRSLYCLVSYQGLQRTLACCFLQLGKLCGKKNCSTPTSLEMITKIPACSEVTEQKAAPPGSTHFSAAIAGDSMFHRSTLILYVYHYHSIHTLDFSSTLRFSMLTHSSIQVHVLFLTPI